MIEKVLIKSKSMSKYKKISDLVNKKFCFDENMVNIDWISIRKALDISTKILPLPKGSIVKLKKINGVNVEVIKPNNLINKDLFLYIHGGGFVSGSASLSRDFCSDLAEKLGMVVYSVDYSLSPEVKAPVASDEVFKVYLKLVNDYPFSNILIGGTSAGGSLALSLNLRIIESHIKRPSLLLLYSPLLDLSNSIKRDNKISDNVIKPGCIKAINELYLGKYKNNELIASPILFVNEFLPPLFIVADENEFLYDDSKTLYDKYIMMNKNVYFIKMKNGYHACQTLGDKTPETKYILEKLNDFYNKIK